MAHIDTEVYASSFILGGYKSFSFKNACGMKSMKIFAYV